MSEKCCGTCCNWKSTGGPNTCGKCALVNITMTPHAGTNCPSHSLDVSALRAEVERLRAALEIARGYAPGFGDPDDAKE